MGVCYGPPDQKEVDETFFTLLEEASHSQSLDFVGGFIHPDICWKDSIAGHKQSRRFLSCIDDKFPTQVMEEPIRGSTLQDLILARKEELVEDVKGGGSLGCSDREMVDLRIMRGGKEAKSMMTALDFRKIHFGQFWDLLERIPWDAVLESSPGELVAFQGMPSLSSVISLKMQEVK